MRIVRGLESFPPDAAPSAIALGVFDGVHLGHRAILGTAVTRARAAGIDARRLESLAARLGFQAHEVPPRLVDGVPVSSSEIRTALQRGDAAAAARFLGRPYAIAGSVTVGAGRGRSLGFPTANIEP